jgi:hypothetical protein
MSTSAEPSPSSLDTVGAAATPSVPSPTPAAVKAGLDGDPLADEMNNAHDALTAAAKDIAPDEDNNPPDPEKEAKALDTAQRESDRLRDYMMRQNGPMKMTVPIVEEAIKAFMKLLKDIYNLLRGKKSDPSLSSDSPGLIAKRDSVCKSIEDTQDVVQGAQNEASKIKQAELDKSDIENDGPSPDSPGAKAMAPK